jgi:hypothetical protein
MTNARIERRFRGPPDSGNGGYFAGLLAKALGGSDIAVTLKRPAPLDEDLNLDVEGQGATLSHSGQLLATAEPFRVDLDVPVPPSPDEAKAAVHGFDATVHIYPGCFVCGPERQKGDGWRIFPGPIGAGRVAAAWTPPAEFADDQGFIKPEFVWAALDCPGYFAVREEAGLALLGRMAVAIQRPVPAEKPLVIQAWSRGSEGRKHRAGTALHMADGTLLAAAEQVWVSLKSA